MANVNWTISAAAGDGAGGLAATVSLTGDAVAVLTVPLPKAATEDTVRLAVREAIRAYLADSSEQAAASALAASLVNLSGSEVL